MQRSSVVLAVLVGCVCAVIGGSDVGTSREVDCSQFVDDYDVIRRLPFPLNIDPEDLNPEESTATTFTNTSTIESVRLYQEKSVPMSIFCLKHLVDLQVHGTPFPNDIVPDALGKLTKLRSLIFSNTKITKITEKMTALPQLGFVSLEHCSLTHLPDLSKMKGLRYLTADFNQLSDIGDIPGVELLSLQGNRFRHIPRTQHPERLEFIDMSHNPLISAAPVMMYENAVGIFLSNASLASIPAMFGKLNKTKYLHLENNRLTHLPASIFQLSELEEFTVHNNSLSAKEIAAVREAFQKSLPHLEIAF